MLKFLENLDRDIQQSLLNQIRDLWTHTSTALEGNTLTLGETKFLIEEGLTISGKPLKDHQEIIGHAKAIDLIYQQLDKPVTKDFLFNLHKAVQTEIVADIYKPNGAWKVEPNGTYTVTREGKQQFLEYAAPADVPVLMSEIIDTINNTGTLTLDSAPETYAKIHMGIAHCHPFWDGNGRIARLVANIPLLKSGLPPIVIPRTSRKEYIETLADYQLSVGQISNKTTVWPDTKKLHAFTNFCSQVYQATLELIENAKQQQIKRSS